MKLVLDDGTEYAIGAVREMNLSTPGEIWQLYPKPGVPQTEEAGQMGVIHYTNLDSLELSISMATMPPDVRRAFMQKVVLEEESRRKAIGKPDVKPVVKPEIPSGKYCTPEGLECPLYYLNNDNHDTCGCPKIGLRLEEDDEGVLRSEFCCEAYPHGAVVKVEAKP